VRRATEQPENFWEGPPTRTAKTHERAPGRSSWTIVARPENDEPLMTILRLVIRGSSPSAALNAPEKQRVKHTGS